MSLLEDHTASFIVRIRREPGHSAGGDGDWRGSIEHVPSGRRASFRDLAAIINFMKPHLTDLGIDTASRFWELMSDDTPPPDVVPPEPVAHALRPRPRRRVTSRS